MKETDSTSRCTSLSSRLRTKQLGRTVFFLDGCTSTNDAGRKLAIRGVPHGSLIMSATQTAGRGRHGRRWLSPRGGIWMTLILRRLIGQPLDALPLIGALSVATSIHNQLGLNSKVRWPNDVVVCGSKVAGVIAECQQEGNSIDFVLLGIGVNANFESHKVHGEKVDATTLMDLCGGAIDRSGLVCDILLELEELLARTTSDPELLLELLRRNDYSSGRRIRIVMDGSMIQGVFVDYESMSSVLVRSEEGLIVVPSASVVLVEYMP